MKRQKMNERLGVIGMVIEDTAKAPEINQLLGRYSELIIGRMGIPRVLHNDKGVSVMSLIIHGTNEEVGALTGKLGNIKGVQVKAALSSK
jgi:putative iron-only hydrogenase system regulator